MRELRFHLFCRRVEGTDELCEDGERRAEAQREASLGKKLL